MAKFKKISTFVLLFLLIFNTKVHSEVVNKVESVGNERISLETIAIFGDITVGKNYEADDINLIIKKLYETSFFSNISIELENGKLTISVKENPIINTIVYDGEKADKYIDKIIEIVALKEKNSFVRSNIKLDINRMKEFYRFLGFYFVDIDVEIEQLDKNRVDLIYKINKGEKAKISKIYFLGDKKIRDRTLRDIITSEESQFWKFLSRNVYLSKDRIDLDKRLLTNFYKDKGYYEVDVSSSNVEYSSGEGFILTYSITAGKRFKFKKITANVDKALDQSAFLSLEEDMNKIVGEYYSPNKLKVILNKINKLSEQRELQFINHEIKDTLEGNEVSVVINIFEGEKFIVERVDIVGNNVTNDSVIRSELIVDEGDPYSVLLVNRSINKLKGRGLFGKVDYKIKEGSSTDLKVLEVVVEEKSTGEIAAGAGVGTDGTSFMFSVMENNWLGKGVSLDTSLSISAEKASGKIQVENPNYKYSGNALFGGASLSSTDKSSTGYKSTRSGFTFGTRFEQFEKIYLAPKMIGSYEVIKAASDASASIKKMDGNFTNLDFQYGIIIDKRNKSFQPTDGYNISFQQTLPLVVDSSAIQNTLRAVSYHELTEDIIGSVKYYAASINGVSEDDVRLTNRIFLPAGRLRGFNTRKVGPKDGSNWVGGNFATGLGFETKLPKLLPESYKTDFSVFFDAANVWHVDYSDTVDNSSKLRSAIGVAANVYTLVGPLSFTLAKDITKATDDETEVFNFRLGTSF